MRAASDAAKCSSAVSVGTATCSAPTTILSAGLAGGRSTVIVPVIAICDGCSACFAAAAGADCCSLRRHNLRGPLEPTRLGADV